MLRNGSLSKSFNGSIIERQHTKQCHGREWVKDRSVLCLTAIRAQIMCLEGLNRVPAVTVGLGIERAWDVRLDSARKHHWVQGSSLQPSISLFSQNHCGLPFAPVLRGNGPAPAPAWWALTNGCFFESWRARLRRSVFYFPPACLGWAFVRLPGFAVLPTWWCAKGLKRLSFVLLSHKSWWFTNKK